ncbi:hypothetical protein KFE98_20570 [bacterium SCSIO 12741]|nr:hypothetical protein KFE98_20570 [bacterium SCSIO 12741]
MKKDNLDELSRKAFPDEAFPFEPQYWEQYQRDFGPKRKKRRGLAWLTWGLPVALIAGLAFWMGTEWNKPLQSVENHKNIASKKETAIGQSQAEKPNVEGDARAGSSSPLTSVNSIPIVQKEEPQHSQESIMTQESILEPSNRAESAPENLVVNPGSEDMNPVPAIQNETNEPSFSSLEMKRAILNFEPENKLFTNQDKALKSKPRSAIAIRGMLDYQRGVNEGQQVGASGETISFDAEQWMGLGIDLIYQRGKWFGATGVRYGNLSQQLNRSQTAQEDWTRIDVSEHEMMIVDSSFSHYNIVRRVVGNKHYFENQGSVYDWDTTWQTIYDTSYTAMSREVEKTQQERQQLSYLSLPLHVGIVQPFGRLAVGVELGLDFHILVGQKVRYIQRTDGLNWTSMNANPVWMTAQLGMDFQYRLSDRLGIYAQPGVHLPVNSPYKNVDRRATMLGLQTGIRFDL